MKPAFRCVLTTCVLGSAVVTLVTTAPGVRAHGTEARYVVEVDWTPARITHTYGLSYSEPGPGAYRNATETRTVSGRECVVGGLIGFDVDDDYAFEIDEPVTLTLTYAPALTTPFTVVWDRNGGNGRGRIEVRPEAGETLRSVTLTLDRARLAGHGTRGVDIAVGSRDGLSICDIAVVRSGGAVEAPAAFGLVRLKVTDAASGRPLPARVGLYDTTGRMPLLSEDAILVHRFTDCDGRGVSQESHDYREAIRWYRRSAEQGHASGQTTSVDARNRSRRVAGLRRNRPGVSPRCRVGGCARAIQSRLGVPRTVAASSRTTWKQSTGIVPPPGRTTRRAKSTGPFAAKTIRKATGCTVRPRARVAFMPRSI